MTRKLGVHFVLLFALMFQNIALAMPCCVPEQQTEHAATEHGMHQVVNLDLHEEDCQAGSSLCCAVPSLPHTPSVSATHHSSSVHVGTVHAFSISFHQTSPERPPRV